MANEMLYLHKLTMPFLETNEIALIDMHETTEKSDIGMFLMYS